MHISNLPITMKDSPNPATLTIGSAVLIFEGEKVLLTREDEGIWQLPGGRIHDDESLIQGAIRETKEEIDVDIEIDKTKQPFIYFKNISKDPKVTNKLLLFIYLAEMISGEPIISDDEVIEIGWFDKNNLPEGTFKNISLAIEYFDQIK